VRAPACDARLLRIEGYLTKAAALLCACLEGRGCVGFLNPHTRAAWASHARPLPGGEPTAADVEFLTAEYRRRGYAPRWEFVTDCYPGVEELLAVCGYVPEWRHPLLILKGAPPEVAPPEGIEIRPAEHHAEAAELLAVSFRAFGMERAPDEGEVLNFQAMARAGWTIFGAWVTREGVPVGCSAQLPIGGISEIAGIAVLPELRRIGIGAALTVAAARAARARGAECVWLAAGGSPARRLYERLGFEPVGTVASLALPSP
jgi:ribosomal protein S18 acetylase RimI-like enzyme